MRKTKKLAVLLCFMMLLTSINTMWVDASATATVKTDVQLKADFMEDKKQDFNSGYSFGTQDRLDTSKLSIDTADGASVLKMIGHKVADWSNSENPPRTAQFNQVVGAISYSGSDAMIGLRFKLDGNGLTQFNLRDKPYQIFLNVKNGGSLRVGSGPAVTMGTNGWHEIVIITSGVDKAKTGEYWYRNGDGDFQYFGTSTLGYSEGTNPTFLSMEVDEGTTLYLDSITMYKKDGALGSVIGGAKNNHILRFADYRINTNYTPASGAYAPEGGTPVTIANYTGADLYRLYEAEGGWPVIAKAISSIGTNNAERTRDLNYDIKYGYALATNSSNSPDGRRATRYDTEEITSDGLVVRTGPLSTGQSSDGSGWIYNTQQTYGWKWSTEGTWKNTINPTASSSSAETYTGDYAFKQNGIKVDMGYSGAVMFTLKLDRDGSVAWVYLEDGENGSGKSVGLQLSNAGITMTGLRAYAYGEDGEITGSVGSPGNSNTTYPMTTGNWYDIVLKNDYNRYTVYARESGSDSFTKVVSGALSDLGTPNTNKTLILRTDYSSMPAIDTKIVKFTDSDFNNTSYKYDNGTLRQYKVEDIASWKVGDKPFEDDQTLTVAEISSIVSVRPVSQVTFGSVATFVDTEESGLTRDDVLGQDAVVINKVQFDAEAKSLVDAEADKINILTSGKKTYGSLTESGLELKEKDKNLQLGWALDNYLDEAKKFDALLNSDMAVEVTYSLPTDKNTTSTMTIQAPLTGGSKRIMMDLNCNGVICDTAKNSFYLENARNRTAAQTALIVRKNGSNDLLWYMKLPNGNYAFVGKFTSRDGDYSPAPLNINIGSYTGTTGDGWKIHSVTRYDLTAGAADSTTIPSGELRKYVDEDFTDLNEASYRTESVASADENKGSVVADSNQLILTNATHGGSGSSGETSFYADYAGIPVGGYADLQFKMQGYLYFTFGDGEKRIDLKINNNVGGSTVNGNTAVNANVTFEPNRWFDLRMVHNADGSYSAYTKQVGETVWNELFKNVSPVDDSSAPLFRVYSNIFMSPFITKNSHTKQYVKNLKIYGPDVDKTVLVLDGNQTTSVPEEGAKLNYGAKVVVAPNTQGRLIFAGYNGSSNEMVAVESVEVTPSDTETVVVPTTLNSSDINTIKVFLWDGFDNVTPVAPLQSFQK